MFCVTCCVPVRSPLDANIIINLLLAPPLLLRTTFNPRWQPVFGRRVTATVCLGAKLINVTNTFEFLLKNKNKKSAWPEKKSQWINKRQAVATLNSPNHSCSKNDYTPLNRS